MEETPSQYCQILLARPFLVRSQHKGRHPTKLRRGASRNLPRVPERSASLGFEPRTHRRHKQHNSTSREAKSQGRPTHDGSHSVEGLV